MGVFGLGLASQDMAGPSFFSIDEPQKKTCADSAAFAEINDLAAFLNNAVSSLAGHFSSIDRNFDDLAGPADDLDTNDLLGGSGRGFFIKGSAAQEVEGQGDKPGRSAMTDLCAIALSGLADALSPVARDEFDRFLSAAQTQDKAPVDAGDMDADKGKRSGAGNNAGGGAPGITVNISGITIQSMNGADTENYNSGDNNSGDLARQIEDAIAQSIQRNASPINTALKEAGFQTK